MLSFKKSGGGPSLVALKARRKKTHFLPTFAFWTSFTFARIVRPANMPVSHWMYTLGGYTIRRAFLAATSWLGPSMTWLWAGLGRW